MNGERVHAAGELAGQRGIDHAVALEPALSAESFRYNIESEMGFAARAMSGMPFVPMRFIFDMQAPRRECRLQPRGNDVLHSHSGRPSEVEALMSTTPTRAFATCQVLKVPPTRSHNHADEIEFAIV